MWLTPEGKPFYAGTYFPKNNRQGMPGFIPVLQELARRWKGPERVKMLGAGEELIKALSSAGQGQGGALGHQTLQGAYEGLAGIYDSKHGGFGQAPKFPSPHHLTFLLRWHLRAPNDDALAMVEKTLRRMWRGGMFDQVGGGFHRYSVDARWLVPHFEKMLYDQAMLTMAYLEAHQLTGKQEHGQAVREVFAYVLRDMTSPEGGFYSAEDADSEGEEGLFYVWTPAQVSEALGPEAGGRFCRVYNITEQGNFEHGLSIAHLTQGWDELARAEGIASQALQEEMASAREQLFEIREERVHPLKDDKIITSWNGLMIAALAMAGASLDEPEYLKAASRAAAFVEKHLTTENGRLERRWRQGHLTGPGYLEDYAFYIWGLIELHQAGQDTMHLERALELTELAGRLFWDDEAGGYFFTPADGEELIFRDKEIYDGALPSGNSVMAGNLLRLGRLAARPEMEERAEKVMSAFAEVVRMPMAYTQLMNALDFAQGPSQEVVVVGRAGEADTKALLAKVRSSFGPRRVLLFRPVGRGAPLVEALAPYSAGMEMKGGAATAYVCEGYACQSPVNDPADLVL